MQRYLKQLSRDIDLIYKKIEKNNPCNAYEDVIDEGEFNACSTLTIEKLKLNEITGIKKQDLPPSGLLTDYQKTCLGEKLESLLWICNFVITVPIVFNYAQRYSFIREVWNNTYEMNKGGVCVIEYYTYHNY